MTTHASAPDDLSASRGRDERPSILLCWGYHRKGWVEPFEKLKTRFRFTYVFYRNEAEEVGRVTTDRVTYWDRYDDAFALLDDVAPEKVVFMSIGSGYPIALNLAAKKRGITTYILQHGMFANYADSRGFERLVAANMRPDSPWIRPPSSLAFFGRTISWRDVVRIPQVVLYFAVMRRFGENVAGRYCSIDERLPSAYICFSEMNSAIHRQVDRARGDQVLTIGYPEYDKFFAGETAVRAASDYYTLIDQPLAQNEWNQVVVTQAAQIEFYRKLNEYCRERGARLKVKLHPATYGETWLPRDEGIDWLEDVDVVSLLRGARGCFALASSLALPAIALRPVCLFRAYPSSFIEDVRRRGVAQVLDFFAFSPSEISFDLPGRSEEALKGFIRDYLFDADGKSTERLGNVLASGR